MKKLILALTLLILTLTTSACNTDKAAILFNRDPITEENVLNNSTIFERNERIYYLILMPKTVHSRYIYIQVIKKDNDYTQLGYKLYWANTFRLKDEQVNYYNDYIVLNESGAYIMKVYSKDNPQKVLTQAQFFVR